jgi:ligand-binding sensor domain-containing protein
MRCLVLAFAAAAFAAPAQPKPAAGPRVAETFEVGPSVYVRALAVEAKRNVLWVGTSAGVNEVDLATGKLRSTFTRKEGLASEYVSAIGIDADGYKWFGTNAGGASRYRDGKWKTYFPMHGLADYSIYAFQNDARGDLWIGTWAGVSRFDRRTGRFRNYAKELVNEWVYGIAVDSKGRLWFGTRGGVSMFDGKAWRSWTQADGLGAPNAGNLPASAHTAPGTRQRHDLSVSGEGAAAYHPNYVFSVHAGPDDLIYAGTWGGGVSRFDGRRWSNQTTKDGLAGDIVYSIARDAEGAFWFGTSAGVSRYDGKAFRNFGAREGLLGPNVYALAVAPDGDVWAGTKGGVARISKR